MLTTESLADRVQVVSPGCWLWTQHLDSEGYGRARTGGGRPMAHRAVYELLVGPIAPGLTLDHLCRVTSCVNPDHLEPVTLRENLRRGGNVTMMNARKIACTHGHAFTPENTRVLSTTGARVCITCDRERKRQHYARSRAC